MGKTTSKKKALFEVFEIDYSSRAPRGGRLASFATEAEAEAFVRGLNYHDPKTSYAVVRAKGG